MISGVAFYTYTLGTITSILSRSDNRSEKMRSKLLALDELAQTYKMPHDLYFKIKKIIKYYYYIYIYMGIEITTNLLIIQWQITQRLWRNYQDQ